MVRVGISRSNVCASILCHVFYQLIYYTGRNPRDRRWEISCSSYCLWIALDKKQTNKKPKKKKKNCGTLLPWLLNMFLTAIKENHAYPKSQNGQNSQTEEQSTAKKVRSIKEKTKKKNCISQTRLCYAVGVNYLKSQSSTQQRFISFSTLCPL